MQQIQTKKVKTSIDIESGNVRSNITGNLNQDNKSGRFTDADTQAFLSILSDKKLEIGKTGKKESAILNELLLARGGNAAMKAAMSKNISLFGAASLQDVDVGTSYAAVSPGISSASAITAEPAKNTIDAFLIGAGMKSDIIYKSLVTLQGEASKSEGGDGDEFASLSRALGRE
jgi:hypothetical protein